MEILKIVLGTIYVIVTGLLILNGLHRYITIHRYLRVHKAKPPSAPELNELPKVTVQLPIYNERYVAERVLGAVCAFDYPREKLEVQVLDDSTDDTAIALETKSAQLRAQGFNVKHIHRTDRAGYKAGALENGLRTAEGAFVAVFDADFIPPTDFLTKTVPFFVDKKIGMVQTRWGHVNRDHSFLTKMLAILLDSHFVVEHIARNRNGLFFNFNGTAGIWRRSCIDDAGGWEHDTLTENLDLSFRAQIKGWQFVYLPDVVCPAELPPEINGVKSQQFRWAKGAMQTARKLLPTLWRAPITLRQKIEATFHLMSYLPTLWALYSSLLIFPAMLLWGYKQTLPIIFMNLMLFGITTITFFMFFEMSQRDSEKSWLKRVMNSTLLMSVWMGLSISNSRAIVEGLLNIKSEFKRTPKFRIEEKGDSWIGKNYIEAKNMTSLAELVMVAYLAFTFLFVLKHHNYFLVPFVAAFIYGFGYVCFLSLRTFIKSLSS